MNSVNLREQMNRAIKSIVIPEFKKQGFVGKYPHFKRIKADNIDLLTFQFNKYGGSFCVEISVAYPNREEYRNYHLFEGDTLEKINACHTHERHRLARKTADCDCWFAFDESNTNEVANHILMLLPSAYKWWENPPIMEQLERRKQNGLLY